MATVLVVAAAALAFASDALAVEVTIGDNGVIEGNPAGTTTLAIPVTVADPAAADIVVTCSTSDGTATTADNDYVPVVNGTATITTGSTGAAFEITVNRDTTVEFPNETINVGPCTVNGVHTFAGGDNTAVGTIFNDDGLTISVFDASVAEGNAGSATLEFTVAVTNGVAGSNITFSYATSDGTATAGSDYTAAGAGGTITTGNSAASFNVTVAGDTLTEANETLTFTLSSPSGATIADGTATGTISNDDGLMLSIGDNGVIEGNSGTTTLQFFVQLDGVAPTGGVTVNYTTADVTAIAGSDYVAANGVLTIPAGNAFGTISITVNGDTAVEDFEFLMVTLSSPTNATIADGTAEGFIINDDFWPACGVVTTQCYSNFVVDLDGATGGLNFVAPPSGLALEAFGVAAFGFVQIQLPVALTSS